MSNYGQASDRRFEVRVTDAQLSRWRELAADQGVSLSELVRFGLEQLEALPSGFVRAELRRRSAALIHALSESVRTARVRGGGQ